MAKSITILDSTLRDGAQGEGISFSVQDKIHIVKALDELGIRYIEAGNPGSNPKDLEFFQKAQTLSLKNSEIVAFGSTRRKKIDCADDANLQGLLDAHTKTVVYFGKSWDFQVTDILHTTLEENLAMIKETAEFLCKAGRNVIFDSEHFFDAWEANPQYTMKTLHAAVEGGAHTLVLCDTKGGAMMELIQDATEAVVQEFANIKTKAGKRIEVGIHTHNDCGLGVANSITAVNSGASHVQGTLIGFGERTGNANLSTIIGNLQLKKGYTCLSKEKLEKLTPICNRVAEIANLLPDNGMPYVGASAFVHKAGMHIDAVAKNPFAYEHVNPAKIGNERSFLMSEVAGRALVLKKINKFDSSIKKGDAIVAEITKKVKELEHEGYQFEGANESFELLVRKVIGKYQPFFKLHYYKTYGEQPRLSEDLCSFAQLKIDVEGNISVTAGEGDGPVHALDTALRKALVDFYPEVKKIRLTDYKVRVLDGKSSTASKVRVLIDSTDGTDTWSTVGVSSDLMEASWIALVDSFEYKLIKDVENKFKNLL
ncbi:MAG TPA: citramalate synthase [Treponemataceae bacterium]|nr:citramalate synthase [Treponemataceae bacterium]